MHRRSAELGPTIKAKLSSHPSSSGPKQFQMDVKATRWSDQRLHLWFRASGATGLRLTEAWSTPGYQAARRDELWRHTCCEAFIRTRSGYYEFNFAPNGDWAAYRFEAYRERMSLPDLAPPSISAGRRGDHWQMQVHLELSSFKNLSEMEPWMLGVSAVVETKEGSLSYWALAHPPGKPDFHHPDSFALTLPPPEPA